MGVRARLVHSPIKSIVCARNRDIDDNVVEGNTFHDHSIMTGIAMLHLLVTRGTYRSGGDHVVDHARSGSWKAYQL